MAIAFSRTTQSLHNETSRLAVLAWSVGGLALAAWLAWFFGSSVTLFEVSRAARIEVQQAPHALASLVAGRIINTTLAIGQEVNAGDVLVALDASSEQLRLKEEESRLAAIRPKITSLEAEIALLEQARGDDGRAAVAALEGARSRTREAAVAVDFARDNERRLREESEAGGVARVEALRAQSETQKLSATRDALSADARKLESDTQTRVRQQQAQIETLRRAIVSLMGEEDTVRATIERLRSSVEKHRLRAPVSGRVGDVVPMRTGGYVAEGQKIATIVPSGELVILADFNPGTALGRVKPGQAARMRLDGFPWTQYGTLSARVNRVASEIRDGWVRVELTVEASAVSRPLLQHGLPGSIEVSVEQASPAVLTLRAAGQMLSTQSTPPPPSKSDGGAVRPSAPARQQ